MMNHKRKQIWNEQPMKFQMFLPEFKFHMNILKQTNVSMLSQSDSKFFLQ